MNKNLKKTRNKSVYEAMLTLKTVEECMSFFDDLLSITEIQAMEQRFQVARFLSEGMVYSGILEKTGASSATISRVNRSLQYGAEGYKTAFKRLDKKGGDR